MGGDRVPRTRQWELISIRGLARLSVRRRADFDRSRVHPGRDEHRFPHRFGEFRRRATRKKTRT